MSYYNVEITEKAKKQLLKMDSRTQIFILNYLKIQQRNQRIHVVKENYYEENIKASGDTEQGIIDFQLQLMTKKY